LPVRNKEKVTDKFSRQFLDTPFPVMKFPEIAAESSSTEREIGPHLLPAAPEQQKSKKISFYR
jgi:hypothetical protein